MAELKESRTEKATPRKLQKAREKGQIARSKEVPAAAVVLGAFLYLFFGGQHLFDNLQSCTRDLLRLPMPEEVTISFVTSMARDIALRFAMIVGPLFLVAMTLGVGANVAQGGITISWHQLRFNFGKLNPKNGLSRLFSKYGLAELAKSLALIAAILFITYQVIEDHLALFPRLANMDSRQLVYWTAGLCYKIGLRIGIFLLVVAVADYALQRHRFLEQLKMTKQEVKDEVKELEGDPLTRSRIRRIQRELARKRMMADVPAADVVITNPTHYAVALSYKMEAMEAPKVVAKGVGFLAIKIKELAQEHDVPRVENRELARALYKGCEVGQFIPVNLYRAVAEILAYIYKTRNSLRY